jgi:hypothetical protein
MNIMKKIYLIFILGATLLFSACKDTLELIPDGRLSYEQVFSDYLLTGGYLNKCYAYIPLMGMGYDNSTFLGVYSDEAQDAQDVLAGYIANYYQGMMTSSSNLVEGGSNMDIYDDMYSGIRKCNVFIDHIDQATKLVVEANRTKWKGEAYALRAFYFWQLIKRFGPLPVIKHDLPVDFDYSTHKRPAFYECVQAIITDCDSALAQPNLPWRSNLEAERGAMTKSVVVAIKSQAILFAASPLWNDGKNYWAEAATITKASLDALLGKNYALYNPATSPVKAYSNYQRFFLVKPEMLDNPANDKETIYSHKGQIGTVWQQHGIPFVADVTKAGASPSQELVDSYETLNGQPVLNLTNPYLDADHLMPNYNTANTQYNKNDPYKNRDPRLFSTIYCNGVFHNLANNTLPVWTYDGGNAGISQTDNRFTRTGYYLRKFMDYTSTKTANKDGYWRYFRLAEMYLNYAEAEFYANGVTTNAINAVNVVRARAGMPILPVGITSTDFELRLRNERRVEFAFEEQRYYDVRRWKVQDKVEGLVTGMKIMQSAPNTFTYERVVVSRRPVTGEKYLMWPIPNTEQLKYAQVGVEYQNKGW